jgi:hypothetical protein
VIGIFILAPRPYNHTRTRQRHRMCVCCCCAASYLLGAVQMLEGGGPGAPEGRGSCNNAQYWSVADGPRALYAQTEGVLGSAAAAAIVIKPDTQARALIRANSDPRFSLTER